jgi:branched-chain amino acid transport system substrate-binding protein
MKRHLALLLSCVLLLGLVTGCAGGSTPTPTPNAGGDATPTPDQAGEKTVTIGVFEPSSGDNGAGGKQEVLGMKYAHDVQPTVEIGGEVYQVELAIVDNGSSNDKAPTAAADLVSRGCSIVLGSYGSSVSIAGSDTFKNAGIPVIGVTCTNPQVTADNSHYFRICFLDPFQGTVLANFASENFQATTAYTLSKQGDDYSGGLCYYFKEAFEALGGTVVAAEFPEGTSDFTSYVTAAKNAGAQVFFAPVSTEAAALIIDNATAQNLGMPILAGDTWDSNVITGAAQGKDVQIYVTTFYQEGGNPDFDSGIKEWINADANRLAENGNNDMIAAVSAMGYDAYFVALEALKKAGSTDPAAVNEALWDVTYTGVSGDIAFESVNGDAIRDVAYVKVANTETGAWDFVAVQGIK